MAAIDATMVSAILNNTLPVATGAKPTNAWLGMVTTSAMYIRLNSTLSTAAASGTQLVNAYGYLTNGKQFTSVTGVTSSSAGSSVSLPGSGDASTFLWTNTAGGSGWTIVSLDITDSAQTRSWWAPFNGQPITVANLNSFQIAASAITVSLT
jgi:hypothetical protein